MLTFSRSPRVFYDTLARDPELSRYREGLGDAWIVNGAKFFVLREYYWPARDALRGEVLRSSYVIVDPEIEDAVLKVVRRLPRREKVNLRGRYLYLLP